MKKAWKLILLISLSVAGIGLVFCVAGFIMGASAREVNELIYNAGGSRYARYVETRIEDVIEENEGERYHHDTDHAEYADHAEHTEYADHAEYTDHAGDESYCYNGVKKLKVEVPMMEVIVCEGDRSDMYVDLIEVPNTLRDAITISQDGEEFKLETDENRSLKEWLENSAYCGTLYIEVPKGTKFEEVSLEVGAGSLSVDDVYAHELDIEVGAGEVIVRQFEAEEVKVQCGTGEAFLNGTVHDEIEIECGIGSVTFNDGGKESDYEYKIDCGIGNVEVGDQYYSGLGSTKEIKNGGATKKMKIDCGIGNVEVYFEEG